MKNIMKFAALAMALASPLALAKETPGEWVCTDTRDGVSFTFKSEDAHTKTMHPTYGRIVQVKSNQGIILISESQMERYYRCFKTERG